MNNGLFYIVSLIISLILFGLSNEEKVGTTNNANKDLVSSSFRHNLQSMAAKWGLDEEADYIDLKGDVYNLQGANIQAQDNSHAEESSPSNVLQSPREDSSIIGLLKERPLRDYRNFLIIQRRKLLNMKKKLDEIHKEISESMNKFCTPTDNTDFNQLIVRDNEVFDLQYENNTEYVNLIMINKKAKDYINKHKKDTQLYEKGFLPIVSQSYALLRYIKNISKETMEIVRFIYNHKGIIPELEKYLKGSKEEASSSSSTSFSLYSHEESEDSGFFSSTKTKVTLGVLSFLLVGCGIGFAIYYKKIMYKN